MTNSNRYFVFREIRNIQELNALFQLRYEEFKLSANEKIITQTHRELDVDIYDFKSKHYGLFLYEKNQEPTLVGCIRLVFDDQSVGFEQEQKWLEAFSTKVKIANNPAPFPLNAYAVNYQDVDKAYLAYKNKQQILREVGRLVIRHDIRSYPLMCFMMQAAAAISFFKYKSDYIWAGCHPNHLPFYKRWGFVDFLTTEYKGQEGFVMYNSKEQLPIPMRKNAVDINKALNKYGAAFFSETRKHSFEPFGEDLIKVI